MSNDLTTATPASMIQTAIEKGVSPTELSQLYELYERDQANQARRAFNGAVAAFKANPPEILKAHEVAFKDTRYSHATLDDIVDAITGPLSAQSLAVRWSVEQGDDRRITVSCILSHVDGHSESTTMSGFPDDSGKKNAIQQLGSTTSYLQRYTLMAVLGLAAKGADNDGRTVGSESEKITDEQVREIEAYISDNELPAGPVQQYLMAKGYESFAELPASKYDGFLAMLRRSVEGRT